MGIRRRSSSLQVTRLRDSTGLALNRRCKHEREGLAKHLGLALELKPVCVAISKKSAAATCHLLVLVEVKREERIVAEPARVGGDLGDFCVAVDGDGSAVGIDLRALVRPVLFVIQSG